MGKSQTLFLFSLHLYEKKVTKSLSLNFLTLVSKSEIYESDFSPPPPWFFIYDSFLYRSKYKYSIHLFHFSFILWKYFFYGSKLGIIHTHHIMPTVPLSTYHSGYMYLLIKLHSLIYFFNFWHFSLHYSQCRISTICAVHFVWQF